MADYLVIFIDIWKYVDWILLSVNKNGVSKFAGKWMNLQNIKLSNFNKALIQTLVFSNMCFLASNTHKT